MPASEAVEEISDEDPAVLDIRDEIDEVLPEEGLSKEVEQAIDALTDEDRDL